MTTPDRIFAYICITICLIAAMFAAAIIFIPSFDGSKTMAMGTVLGALITLATTIAGITRAKVIDRRNGNGIEDRGAEK